MMETLERRLRGMPISPGIVIATVKVEVAGSTAPGIYSIRRCEKQAEWDRLEKALCRTEVELNELKARVEHMSGADEAAIFDAHLLFLRDRSIMSKLHVEFDARMQNMEAVYYAVVQNFMELMRRVEDAYLRSRVADMEDVLRRVLKNMAGEHHECPSSRDKQPHILAAYDLSPSSTADLNRDLVRGFVTEAGSTVSHTAILARSLGLPAIVGIEQLTIEVKAGQEVIIDGYEGLFILNPSPETKEEYLNLRAEKEKAYKALALMRDLPAETTDGRHIRVATNVEFAHEYSNITASGAEGVGLYRTEFFLLNDGNMPNEEEQYVHYKDLVEACAPEEVIFRSLDAGGDKLPFERDVKEDNPFLGWRGIRVSLSRPEIFKDQLRAILRASAHGKAGVMFPMISGYTEVIRVKKLLQDCRDELNERGQAYDPNLRVGVMIEVPSAAMMADVLAPHVDFFSIGTNDLTQYTIAVDRVNRRVADMFRPAHPGVIRLIDQTIRAGIPTAICGETGSDLNLVPLLIGLGATELSVGVHVVPLIRYAIRHLNYEECREMAQLALKAQDSSAIKKLSREIAIKSYPNLFH